MFCIVAAQSEPPHFQFDGKTFQGDKFEGSQSSVFQYQSISNGTMFNWTQTAGPKADVVRVDLMNTDNQTILFWCREIQDCRPTEGFYGSSLHA